MRPPNVFPRPGRWLAHPVVALWGLCLVLMAPFGRLAAQPTPAGLAHNQVAAWLLAHTPDDETRPLVLLQAYLNAHGHHQLAAYLPMLMPLHATTAPHRLASAGLTAQGQALALDLWNDPHAPLDPDARRLWHHRLQLYPGLGPAQRYLLGGVLEVMDSSAALWTRELLPLPGPQDPGVVPHKVPLRGIVRADGFGFLKGAIAGAGVFVILELLQVPLPISITAGGVIALAWPAVESVVYVRRYRRGRLSKEDYERYY